jgi:hypothetical protein
MSRESTYFIFKNMLLTWFIMSLWQCGDTALVSASSEDNDAAVELLIEAGANLDAEVDEVRFLLQ